MLSYDYVIIGNGILGIHLGRLLASKDLNYIILEKSRNVGGRFASRRFKDFKFNFGTRSFRWDKTFLNEEINLGISNSYLQKIDDEIFAESTFNDWTKDLSSKLNVTQLEVETIERSKSNDFIINNQISCEKLIVTAPADQAYNLVKDLGDFDYLKDAKYLKESFYMYSSKQDYTSIKGLTLLSSDIKDDLNYYFCKLTTWSELSRDDIKKEFDLLTNPIESFAHKWRYSRIDKMIDYKQVDPNIFCLGDYYEGEVKGSINSAKHFKKTI